ncbi:amidohydrolase family protein [Clostridiales Family XIII bacterium ASD5510]|uniref:Amidohydrolase family protein n=1 Tax=Hominibacterium faecale TaxID=2839743 RepID=A0A9J6QST3_9FIRM|nr:amidohydrolase family protein [Hominibacterium faecale]MCU7379282.1 amidohydrolase family protein [Hominibacterium faecale]
MKADIIIKNGRVFSAEKADCIAIGEGKIIKVGTEKDMKDYEDKGATILDAERNSVIPVFIDAHLHASSCTELFKTKLMYGFERHEGEGRQEYIDRMVTEIKAYCDSKPDAPIIRIVGWNPAEFQQDPEGEPTCKDLDKICEDRPLTMRSYDHHYLLVNSKVLERAGITKDTEDPSGGMKRDSDGNPTGLFREMQAINIVFDHLELADFSVEEYKEGLLAFQDQHALPNGIMGIFDAYASKNAMAAYQQLAKAGELKIRVRTAWLADPGKDDSQFDRMIAEKGKYDVGDDFKIETIKFFCDDGLFGFYMNEPFEKEILRVHGLQQDYRGSSQWSDERLKAIAIWRKQTKWNLNSRKSPIVF